MPSLVEIQRGVAAAMISGDPAALAGLGIVAGAISPAARIDIYRRNVFGNYRKALATTFPVVRQLVGAAFFNAAADTYVRAHPSTRGDVNRYGDDLAGFLATYEPARMLVYLPDIARLEWAIDQAAIAADAPPFDLAALAALPERAHAGLRLCARIRRRAVRRIALSDPAHLAGQPGGLSKVRPRSICARAADSLLVVRGECGVDLERLKPGEAALLDAAAAAELSLLPRVSRPKPNRIRSVGRAAAARRQSCAGRIRRARIIHRRKAAMNAFTSSPLSSRAAALYCRLTRLVDRLQPLLALGLRLYVARVFLLSGLTKIHDWSVTLALFENEYHVPVLSPSVAAALGTATELSMPVLLALGLGTRFAAAVLFVFNIVAVVSYPDLPDIAVKDHILWGLMLLVLLVHGPGPFSADRLLSRRLAEAD
jgi:putative oxidoreductase